MESTYGHHCLVCGRTITWRFAICTNCEKTYGHTSSQWPDWLAYMWREQVKQRRRDKVITARELTYSDMTYTTSLGFEVEEMV